MSEEASTELGWGKGWGKASVAEEGRGTIGVDLVAPGRVRNTAPVQLRLFVHAISAPFTPASFPYGVSLPDFSIPLLLLFAPFVQVDSIAPPPLPALCAAGRLGRCSPLNSPSRTAPSSAVASQHRAALQGSPSRPSRPARHRVTTTRIIPISQQSGEGVLPFLLVQAPPQCRHCCEEHPWLPLLWSPSPISTVPSPAACTSSRRRWLPTRNLRDVTVNRVKPSAPGIWSPCGCLTRCSR